MDWLTPSQVAVASALIALGALTVSLVTLWKTHFARFNPLCTVGGLGLRVFPIRSEKDRWYIPSFDVQLSVTNNAASPGVVQGLRLALHYPSLPIPNNREFIYARFEVDPLKFKRADRNRFAWLDEVKIGDWAAFHVLPRQAVSKHFLFEARWDDPVVQDDVDCTLELQIAATGHWISVASWKLSFGQRLWSTLLSGRKAVWSTAADPGGPGSETIPADLHKYTGTRGPVPDETFVMSPSYLDYPDSDKPTERALEDG